MRRSSVDVSSKTEDFSKREEEEEEEGKRNDGGRFFTDLLYYKVVFKNVEE